MICSYINTSSQPRDRRDLPFPNKILLENDIIPTENSIDAYISFRIPFSQLIFIKNDSEYSGGLIFSLEIHNKQKVLDRKSVAKQIKVAAYEETRSENAYLHGFIKIDSLKEDLIILPSVTIQNSNQSIQLDTIKIQSAAKISNEIFTPLLLAKSLSDCRKKDEYQLINQSNSIPFSPENYSLLFALNNDEIEDLEVIIEQDGKEIIKRKINSFFNTNYKLEECDNSILLVDTDESKQKKYFMINDFSFLLDEGEVIIKVVKNEHAKREFKIPVRWINKPKSLTNPEFAIELLRIIDKEERVDSLLNNGTKDYNKVLNKYWDEKKSKTDCKFNELKYEFYRRADYAMENFSTIGNFKGAMTDRGKTYIKFGKPDNVSREYSNSGIVKEIWKYYNLNKEFIFTDNTGLGNYTLDKGK